MDVGNPSNMERLRSMYPTVESLRTCLSADSVDDAAIRARITADYADYGRIWCPHTAVAAEVYRRLPAEARRKQPWVLVATAHPAKFNEIVEPLVGTTIEVPPSLARLLRLPRHCMDVAPTLSALAAVLA
jgi:threonine synthase